MDIEERIRVCRLTERIKNNPDIAKCMKIEDTSHYRKGERTAVLADMTKKRIWLA